MIYKSYKTELKPNNKQKTLLLKNCGAARYAYNWALNIKKEALFRKEKPPTAYELHKRLNILKKSELSWMYEVSKCSPQEALSNCDKAFKNFFFRCKNKTKGKKGFPRFKSRKNGVGSFSLTGMIKTSLGFVQLPRLGKLKLKELNFLPINKKILRATVSEKAGRWFVSILVQEEINSLSKSEAIIGIDLGIKTLATCSDGNKFENPNALKNNLDKLKRLSKQFSRKVKGGNNRKKAARKLARLHYKITCIRKDCLHKITSFLTKTKSKIVIENLNISGLMKNRRLSRSISDLGLFELRRQLEYKGKWYGCEIVVADRFFPSSKKCSRCGHIKGHLSLSDRVFICDNCGLNIDRDYNASINLEKYTVGSTEINAFGEVSSDLALAR
jgi:putative transposase